MCQICAQNSSLSTIFARQISFISFTPLSSFCIEYHAPGAYAESHIPPSTLTLPSREAFNSY